MATCSDDKSLRLWNLETHQMTGCKMVVGAARACAFSQDGHYLAVGLSDGQVFVYQTEKVKREGRARIINLSSLFCVSISSTVLLRPVFIIAKRRLVTLNSVPPVIKYEDWGFVNFLNISLSV